MVCLSAVCAICSADHEEVARSQIAVGAASFVMHITPRTRSRAMDRMHSRRQERLPPLLIDYSFAHQAVEAAQRSKLGHNEQVRLAQGEANEGDEVGVRRRGERD